MGSQDVRVDLAGEIDAAVREEIMPVWSKYAPGVEKY